MTAFKESSPRVAGPLKNGSLARREPTALGGLRRSLASASTSRLSPARYQTKSVPVAHT